MQTIETKVQVGADRRVSVQLPTDAPTGEYDVVLVLSRRSAEQTGSEVSEATMAQRWEEWLEQVEQLPLPENSGNSGKCDFQHCLIEKYRKQGLEL